jgi:serine/threonine-protein kinase
VPHPITQVDSGAGEVRHRTPTLLSDGRTVAFTVERARNGPRGIADELALVRLDDRSGAIAPHHRLGVAGRAVALVDGWLVYIEEESATLFAVRIDVARGTTTGAPIAVFRETTGTLRSVSLANDGTLLYVRSAAGNAPVIVNERGTAQPLSKSAAGNFMNPRVSPDGQKIAVQSSTPRESDVWIYDIATGTPTRLTSGSSAYGIAWTRDGRQVIFVTSGAAEALWRQAADGSTPAEPFLNGAGIGSEVTPDGRSLLFAREQQGRWAIWTVGLTGSDRTPRPLFTDAFDANMPAISPDGRWLAYVSKPAGREEIFVRPFPGPGSAVQISSGGGTEPAWSNDGRRIFYRAERQMMSADVSFSPMPSVTARRSMFRDTFGGEMPHRNYDVLPGNRFVMIAAENTAPEVVIVLNWLPELRTLLAQSVSQAPK